ncbi:MAG TPA: zinc dependent phospholipase C family protein [Candidatus Sulfotelmatobacter sp.]|nr:zinc dependent phospholipase C family protein [Candidatus Sulfotelmatobacter sp.]
MKPFLHSSHSRKALLWLGFVFVLAQRSGAYSVLTHEQVVDLLWEVRIQPMLMQRFPDLTDKKLRDAHAYAYGGSLVQDMGYYPFGSRYFSDLTHYVRTGDFVVGLIQEAQNPNEYAFALGALAHYAADNSGHPMVNHVVAMEFPALQKKYGDVVTYADSPNAHIRAEFGFDMTQVAKNRYTSDRYHDFVGFEISQALIERVFPKIYGIKFDDVVDDEDLAIGSFRHAVSKVIPQMTRVALLTRRKEIVADTPDAAEKKYLYYLSRTDYEREWGTEYRKPGFGTKVLAIFLKLFPKTGPFSGLDFKVPSQPAEDRFIVSVDETVRSYRQLLLEAERGTLHLANKDCDTGLDTKAGEYVLSDLTYAHLVDNLSDNDFKLATPELRDNVLAFYSNPDAPLATKRKKKDWKRIQDELEQLKTATVITANRAPAWLAPTSSKSGSNATPP